MKTVGYIITKHKITKDILEGIEFLPNMDNLPENYPYLLVGLNEAKKNIENFSILNHKIDNLGTWTFGKTERRNDYEKELNKFYDRIISNIIFNIKYYYVNILNIKYNKFKKMYNIINSLEKKYIYISNDMIFIYVNNYVLGISLGMAEYCGIKRENIIKRMALNTNNIIFYDDNFLSPKLKNLIRNNQYLIPYFKSLE